MAEEQTLGSDHVGRDKEGGIESRVALRHQLWLQP